MSECIYDDIMGYYNEDGTPIDIDKTEEEKNVFTINEMKVLKEVLEFYNSVDGGIRLIDYKSYESILKKLDINK